MGLFRFLLAFCVVIAHVSGPSDPLVVFNYMHPTTAVEVFFVISGFYMQMVLSEKYTANKLGRNWVLKFYGSRYTRLMPIYLVCLGATALYLMATRHTFDLTEYPHSPTIALEQIYNLSDSVRNIVFKLYFLFTNIFLFFQDVILNLAVSGGQAHLAVNRSFSEIPLTNAMLVPQAWSLGVELTFYAMAPFLLRVKNRNLLIIFALLMLVKLAFISAGKAPNDLYYRVFPFVLPYFLLGALVYRYRENLNVFKADKVRGIQLLHVYVFTIFVCLLIPHKEMTYSVLLVLICGVYLPSLFYATKNNKWDRYIGEASYPIYVFHIFFYMVMANNWRTFEKLAIVLKINHVQLIALLAIVATFVVSAICVWVEFAWINPVRSRLFENKGA